MRLMKMILKIALWTGGVGLGLHLLACGQQAKMPSENKAQMQKRPVQVRKMEEKDPIVKPEKVGLTGQAAGIDGGASGSASAKNSHPKVVSVSLDPPDRVYRGVDITAVPKGEDPDGDEIRFRYQWVINGEEPVAEDSPVLKGDRFKRGDWVSVHITPSDQEGEGEVFRPLPIVIPDAPPKFTSTPPMEFKALRYAYQAAAEDPDGDPVTFSLASAPHGMRIDPETGRIDWEITRDDVGDQTIEVVAEDGLGGKASQKYTLSITFP